MTILFLIGAMSRGGKERRLQILMEQLSKSKKYDIHLLVRNGVIDYHDFKAYNIKFTILFDQGETKSSLKTFLKLWQYVRANKPHIIHVWGTVDATYMIPISRFFKIPVINNQVTTATPPTTFEKYISKLNFIFADHIVSNSFAGLKAYKAPMNKSSVIYNGFNFDRFACSESLVRSELGIPEKALIIVMAARMYPGKDFESLVSVSSTICKKHENIYFLLIGDGPERNRIENISTSNENRIKVLGLRTDVENILIGCDIGVLLNDASMMNEGLSNSILEYMAAGLPVVATDTGGTPEIVQDGVTGYLVESKDLIQIQEKLEKLISDPVLRKSMGERAKERILKDFSINEFVNKHRRLIDHYAKK